MALAFPIPNEEQHYKKRNIKKESLLSKSKHILNAGEHTRLVVINNQCEFDLL